MSSAPKLSILMSVYNAEMYVDETIHSILGQRFEDFELLVADDGSSDNSKAILDSVTDSRIRFFHNECNIGKVATINKLYRKAIGKYVTIHDADDLSATDRFLYQISLLEQDINIVMCGCSFVSIADGGFVEQIVMESDFEKIRRSIVFRSQFHGPTMVIRRSIIETRLSKELLRSFFTDYNEDCDLSIRLTEVGDCTNLKDILYYYRVRKGSLSKTLSERKKCLYPMLVHFHRQREKRGKDDLQEGLTHVAERKLEFLIRRTYPEPSAIYREMAAFYMHYKWYSEAIGVSIKAVKIAPMEFKNWMTLQYCLRKYLVKI